ncbi:proton-coupled folate transporter [Diorhabda sublineata]|uniref:proton-coupled folate transporter n=1 Tax=Diorhabda sublineata TaxID=1163346 RepID=UPI0024E049B6|nr:proton-coupled folate transporter [Diorhabda sublineata]XP_056640547.1 proton-coupled folate transporter [Diorhabda sublineata]
MDESNKFRYKNKFIHYCNYITVEPTMILYMMAFMITSVVEQSFYIFKACTVNHGFNATLCHNINEPEYKNITKEVQKTVAKFHIYNNIAGHFVPIVLAFFIGSWSDKRGRKSPLLIGLFGKLFFSLMIIVNSYKKEWPLEYVTITATLPSALTGADVAIFASALTYLIDVSSVKNRTIRVTVLEVCYLATMPIGVALGSYLFKYVLNKSYSYMFVINSSLMILSMLYSSFRLKWRSNPKQKPLSEAKNKILDFFDYNHVVATTRVLSRKRSNNKRTYFWLLLIMMALYTFQRDEREIMFMYCQLTFNWAIEQFSIFRTVQSGLQDLILLIAIPVMSKVLGFRDTVIIIIGALAHTIARIFYFTADITMFYIGGVFASFGPIVAPVIRSLVSKIVPISEKGKAFAVLSVADNAVPLISGTCYNALYQLCINLNPGIIFFLTATTQISVFLLILYIHLKTDRKEFENENVVMEITDSTENDKLRQEM